MSPKEVLQSVMLLRGTASSSVTLLIHHACIPFRRCSSPCRQKKCCSPSTPSAAARSSSTPPPSPSQLRPPAAAATSIHHVSSATAAAIAQMRWQFPQYTKLHCPRRLAELTTNHHSAAAMCALPFAGVPHHVAGVLRPVLWPSDGQQALQYAELHCPRHLAHLFFGLFTHTDYQSTTRLSCMHPFHRCSSPCRPSRCCSLLCS
jgi:hypothetical protein